jgi:hypothetical protein
VTYTEKYKQFKRGVRVYDKGHYGVITRRRHVIHPLAGKQAQFDVEVKWDGQGLELVSPSSLRLESEVLGEVSQANTEKRIAADLLRCDTIYACLGVLRYYLGNSVGDHLNNVLRLEIETNRGEAAQKVRGSTIVLPEHERHEAAADALANYDFGEEAVLDSNGWEFDKDEATCTVFLEQPQPPSSKVKFVVRFKPGTAEVEEAYISE